MKTKSFIIIVCLMVILGAASAPSAAAPGAQPYAPSTLTATVLNDSRVVLYWHDNSNNEKGFKIERLAGIGADWEEIAAVRANGPQFDANFYVDTMRHTGLTAYRIRAYDTQGKKNIYSAYSNEAAVQAIPVSTGFDFPVGNREGDGAYLRHDTGATCDETMQGHTWYVAYDVTDPRYRDHTGEDWNGACGGDTDRGQPVYAASDGRVVYAGYIPSLWGNVVLIAHMLEDGEIVYSQYAHLETINVSPGQSIARRQEIGSIGKGAGNKLVAHLHFEIRKVTVAAGNWPKAQNIIQTQYYEPSDRGASGNGKVTQFRYLKSAPLRLKKIS